MDITEVEKRGLTRFDLATAARFFPGEAAS
jgi:hypothetical protein